MRLRKTGFWIGVLFLLSVFFTGVAAAAPDMSQWEGKWFSFQMTKKGVVFDGYSFLNATEKSSGYMKIESWIPSEQKFDMTLYSNTNQGWQAVTRHMNFYAGNELRFLFWFQDEETQFVGQIQGKQTGGILNSATIKTLGGFAMGGDDNEHGAGSVTLTGKMVAESKVNIPSIHTPVISNLHYSPQSVAAKQGDIIIISADIDFADSGGDVAALRITCPGVLDITTSIAGANGQTNGTITGILSVTADRSGTYPFQIWVVDSKGNSSNKLNGNFEIIIGGAMGSGPWSMFLHDARHTGRSPSSVGSKMVMAWNSRFDQSQGTQGVTGLVVSSSGTVYAGHINHYLYAISPSNGSVKWQFLTEHEVVGSPALDINGNIYVGSKDRYLYCLTPDGTLKWKFKLDSAVTSSPVISPQNVIYVATYNRFYAFSSEGVSLWRETYDGGLTYFDGRAYGSQSTPAIDDSGTIYLIARGGAGFPTSLCAFEPSGSLKWSVPVPEGEFSSPAIGDNGIIYCAGGHMATGGQYSLNAVNPDGTLLWTYALPDMPYLANPAIAADGTVYIGCNDYYLYAINPNGTLKWKYLLSNTLNGSSLAIDASGAVLVTDGGPILYAIKPDGTLKWQINAFQMTSSSGYAIGWLTRVPVIASNGRIYMGHEDGVLALDVE